MTALLKAPPALTRTVSDTAPAGPATSTALGTDSAVLTDAELDQVMGGTAQALKDFFLLTISGVTTDAVTTQPRQSHAGDSDPIYIKT